MREGEKMEIKKGSYLYRIYKVNSDLMCYETKGPKTLPGFVLELLLQAVILFAIIRGLILLWTKVPPFFAAISTVVILCAYPVILGFSALFFIATFSILYEAINIIFKIAGFPLDNIKLFQRWPLDIEED